jgi:hypothetical protein
MRSPSAWWSTALAALAAWAVVTAVTCALFWPLPLSLRDGRPDTAFFDSYVWCFDHMARMVTGERPWSLRTGMLGYPSEPDVRFVAWAPALAAMPFRGWLGPLGAVNLVWLASPGWAALAAFALYRRLVGARPWAAAAGAVAYALCPVALGCLASGQFSKLQSWTLPVWGVALLAILGGDRLILPLLGFGLLTIVIGFTSPVHAMFLPLVGGVLGIAAVARGGSRVRLALLAGVAALALLPARAYFGDLRDTTHLQAFIPANVEANQVFGPPPTIAQPAELLLGTDPRDARSPNPKHIAYFGIPALLAVALLARRRFPGRAEAVGLVTVGIVIAFGPRLATGGAFVPGPVWLPAELLALVHYPLAESGMWYRTMFVAALGLGAVIAGGASGRSGVLLAWVLGVGWVADGWRVSRELWPKAPTEVAGRALFEEMDRDPAPGAVLDLPLTHNPHQAGVAMLDAVFHQRAVVATARHGSPRELPHLASALAALQAAVAAPDRPAAHRALQAAGFRYVVAQEHGRNDDGISLDDLERALGAPHRDRWVSVWTIDPDDPGTEAASEPRPDRDRGPRRERPAVPRHRRRAEAP